MHALAAGIQPDIVIGDGDSLHNANVPPELMLRVPVEKDDTDTMLCIRYALKEGFTECVIVGGVGGRLDHTIANLQTLAFAYENGMRATLCDAQDSVLLLGPGELALSAKKGLLSPFFRIPSAAKGLASMAFTIR
jgi:thiamine pyrophosphokinase